jgi:hypothetical protein
MSAARGDRKPCIRTACPGTMQFGREPSPRGPAMTAEDGERGWVCSEKAEHFQRASERSASEVLARRSADASWDDDGGADSQVSYP